MQTIKKDGGNYENEEINYRLRGIGDIAEAMLQVCKDHNVDHKLIKQNIGNVPEFVEHPGFMAELELDKRYPGLKDKLAQSGGALTF